MVVETHKPMQCPDCGVNVKLIQIDDYNMSPYGVREECIVDPKPVSSTNAGLTYKEHECDKENHHGNLEKTN